MKEPHNENEKGSAAPKEQRDFRFVVVGVLVSTDKRSSCWQWATLAGKCASNVPQHSINLDLLRKISELVAANLLMHNKF